MTKTESSFLSRVLDFFGSLVDAALEEGGREDEPRQAKRPRRSSSAATSVARYPLVPQDDETGCGVACIAMLVGEENYEKVKAKLFGSKRKRVFYTGYKDLRRGLEHYGLSFESQRARRFTTFAHIDGTAIVAVEQVPPHKSKWHWVVFVHDGRRRYVLDPSWDGIVRTDLRRLKGRTFLTVVEGPAARTRAKRRSRSSAVPS